MKNLIFTLSFLMLAACSNSKDSSRSVKANTGATVSANFNLNTQCPQGTNGIGSIFDTPMAQGSLYGGSGIFEDRVKGLLSASVASQDVGHISGAELDSTGVRFQGVIHLDGQGVVAPASSRMLIKVYDSFILNAQLDSSGAKFDAIQIEFLPGPAVQTSGQFNLQTGDGFISFKDSYGEVRFEGRLDAQNFTGLVKFQNAKNVNVGAAPVSGTLGQFKVARCGIIQ